MFVTVSFASQAKHSIQKVTAHQMQKIGLKIDDLLSLTPTLSFNSALFHYKDGLRTNYRLQTTYLLLFYLPTYSLT